MPEKAEIEKRSESIRAMKKRRRKIILGILALIICGGLAALLWPEKEKLEPVYKGKKLSEWVVSFHPPPRFLYYEDEAERAINAIGTNAIPFYLEWLDYKPNLLKRLSFDLAEMGKAWLPFTNFRDDFKVRRSVGAYLALIHLDEKAAPAIPTLLAYATNFGRKAKWLPSKPENAVYALSMIGRPAVPAIISMMTNKNVNIRLFVMRQARILHNDPEIVAQFRRALRDPVPEVRIAATNCFKEKYDKPGWSHK
jgi:hypothetical protein